MTASSKSGLAAAAYDHLLHCNRCGQCQNYCPTYKNSLNETQVARGRLHILRLLADGVWDWEKDREAGEAFNNCLLCGACFANCPASVATPELMAEARYKLLQINGFSLFHRLMYRGMLTRQQRLAWTARLARLAQRGKMIKLVDNQIIDRLSARLRYLNSFLPKLSPPARFSLKTHYLPAAKPKIKVIYFLGCATNAFYGQIARAMVKFLEQQGVEVYIPLLQCCGGPHYAAGDWGKAAAMLEANLKVMEEIAADFVISDCATCVSSLAGSGVWLEGSGAASQLRARQRSLAAKLLDINTFIIEKLSPRAELRPQKMAITYHDPCHAVRGLGVRDAPRQVLRLIPGLELREMESADSCCGGAGIYWLFHEKTSEGIVRGKLRAAAATKAEALASSCPSCIMQLNAGARREGVNIKIMHPVELLV
jgi:glycolate oxidase iron-sulfur subunit